MTIDMSYEAQVDQVFSYFSYDHLPPALQPTSRIFHTVASALVTQIPASPELLQALRKLLEAKDCAVRANLVNAQPATPDQRESNRMDPA